MTKLRSYTVGNVYCNKLYTGIFPGHNNKSVYVDSTEKVKEVDYLVLWGGEDISPALYDQKVVRANAGTHPSSRDLFEKNVVAEAVEREVPIIGICRGAQLLCSLDGGSLWQHVTGHGMTHHNIVDQHGEVFYVNSDHHQVMRPGPDAFVIAQTEKSLSNGKKWSEIEEDDIEPEPEIVFFPKLNAIGVQPHPEWVSSTALWVQYTKQLYKEYLCL